jgi:hypothetical protein
MIKMSEEQNVVKLSRQLILVRSDIELFFPKDLPGRRERILQELGKIQSILDKLSKESERVN